MFQFLAIGAALTTYATMVLGGYVKSIGAGLACPDWPLCEGAVVPDLSRTAIAAEWTHRVVALSTSAFLGLTMAAAVLWYRTNRVLVFLASTSVMLLAAQVTLGALTITSQLDPAIVTGHLAIATAVFASALTVAILSMRLPDGRAPMGTAAA